MNPRVKTPEGDVIGVPPSDEDMRLASQHARDSFATFAEQFQKRDPACSIFIVKVFYPDPKVPGGGEHLWMTVRSVTDTSAVGRITSRPLYISAVKSGDLVEARLPQLSDWLYVHSGRAVGAYTVQLLRSRMTPEQKAQHDSAYPFSFE
jgi:uncharacterized protein YegJ (DUF2314 family)